MNSWYFFSPFFMRQSGVKIMKFRKKNSRMREKWLTLVLNAVIRDDIRRGR